MSTQTIIISGNKLITLDAKYLVNAYRVLLTHARQVMVIAIPEGNEEDHTRSKEYYDVTYNYLRRLGFKKLWIQ